MDTEDRNSGTDIRGGILAGRTAPARDLAAFKRAGSSSDTELGHEELDHREAHVTYPGARIP